MVVRYPFRSKVNGMRHKLQWPKVEDCHNPRRVKTHLFALFPEQSCFVFFTKVVYRSFTEWNELLDSVKLSILHELKKRL